MVNCFIHLKVGKSREKKLGRPLRSCWAAQKRYLLFKGPGFFIKNVEIGENVEYFFKCLSIDTTHYPPYLAVDSICLKKTVNISEVYWCLFNKRMPNTILRYVHTAHLAKLSACLLSINDYFSTRCLRTQLRAIQIYFCCIKSRISEPNFQENDIFLSLL